VHATTFAALADPSRLRIFELLRDGPLPVGEIGDALQLRQPQVSKHLRVLKDAGLVDVEARAQQRLYALQAAPLRDLHAWLERYRAVWDERYDQLADVLAEMKKKKKKHERKR
jgi:DNA-binding transcriptional ArsR family regulator